MINCQNDNHMSIFFFSEFLFNIMSENSENICKEKRLVEFGQMQPIMFLSVLNFVKMADFIAYEQGS